MVLLKKVTKCAAFFGDFLPDDCSSAGVATRLQTGGFAVAGTSPDAGGARTSADFAWIQRRERDPAEGCHEGAIVNIRSLE